MRDNKGNDLEGLRKLTKRVSSVPFHVVIKCLYECEIIALNPSDPKDKELLEILSKVADKAARDANRDGIFRSRPNEVGNDMENYVKAALRSFGFVGEIPRTRDLKHQSAGYPDIYMEDRYGRPVYLEVKTYNKDNLASTQRTFYLSPPSESSAKVTVDAHHLVIAFEIQVTTRNNQRCYIPVSWKIVSIREMPMALKHEFNSSNRDMYSAEAILSEGELF